MQVCRPLGESRLSCGSPRKTGAGYTQVTHPKTLLSLEFTLKKTHNKAVKTGSKSTVECKSALDAKVQLPDSYQ